MNKDNERRADEKAGRRGNRQSSRYQSSRIAFCGLTAALSIVLMISGGIIPIATYCVPMMAGVLLLPAMVEYGKKTAWTTYAAVALIVLILGIDKEAAVFYLFFGCYPLLKWEIDRIRKKTLRLLCKILVFNAALAGMYLLLGLVLNMQALVQEFMVMGPWLLILFIVVFNVCLFLFDRLMAPLVIIYVHKIRPRFRFLIRH